jgi:hypothetical protein
MKNFNRPCEFPNEAFVQKTIEDYFVQEGYTINGDGQIDLEAWKNNNDKWIIDAKGMSESIRTDFNTCIGQLIGHIDNDITKYAIAIPKIKQYLYQCKNLSIYIREKLKLYVIVVDETGYVEILNPTDVINHSTTTSSGGLTIALKGH